MSKTRQKEFLDTATKRVVADYTHNEPANLMELIQRVNRACPGQSKQNIAYLLKNNEYDVEETVRRINEEGAKELIGEWSKSTSKKKKKKRKDETAPVKEIPPSAPKPQNSVDARPSSNSVSSKPAQLSNSTSPKPSTAPSVAHTVPSHPYTASLPVDGYPNNTYSNYHQVPHSLPPHNNLISATTSLPSNNMQFLLLQLQTHTSYLSQWQGILQQRMDASLQILGYVFQQLQTSLSERHQLLQQSIETGKFQAEEIFAQRKKLAQRLTVEAKSAPGEAVAERIKQFLADKQNDQQLCDVYNLSIDHEAILAALSSLGDIVNSIPQYSHWTSDAEPANVQHTPHPQQQPQQIPHKTANKHTQPVYQAPEFQPPPVQNFAPAPPAPVYTEPEVPEPFPEETTPEVLSLAPQVYEVTLNDPYSSSAKPVDLTSGARQKSSQQELEAARERMQGVLNKQNRGMIVSDKGSKTGQMGPTGKRGGERKGGRGGEGREGGGGGRGKPGGRNAGTEKRGPPVRSEEWDSQGGRWDGSRGNGPTFSAEFTNSNLEKGQDEAWDNPPDYVPSLVLTNNNYDSTPDESGAPYESLASTEFKPTIQESSPDEPVPLQPQLDSFIPTQPEDFQPQPQPQPEPSEPKPAFNLDWDDDTMVSTDWGLDHEAS